jgi:membrane dipeptidase
MHLRFARVLPGAAVAVAVLAGTSTSPRAQETLPPRAVSLHKAAIVVDTHADTTQRLINHQGGFDLGVRHADGSIDIPRMREGGLDALFFSIWTEGTVTGAEGAFQALRQIDRVVEAVRQHPADLVLATTVADIRRAHEQGRIAALLGLEGGHMLADDLAVLRTFARLGVRYVTLTHNYDTSWADASQDAPRHGGLTPFGRDVVREMNRLGVMVDISHVADTTFNDVLATTAAPVIASHSSCRALSSHVRNMSDDMIRALARNGGVMMINYHMGFLDEAFYQASKALQGEKDAEIARACRTDDDECKTMADARIDRQWIEAGRLPAVKWERILDHIDHAVKVGGVDHVGLGSDFDGASMPIGMEDASMLPKITAGLLARGYSEGDVRKILGENLLRVMGEVERVAAQDPGKR